MSKLKKIRYSGARHGSFDDEWGIHKNCSEWWYATGYFHDISEKLYSYQITLLRIKLLFLRPYVVMLALTDFDNKKHYYYQDITLSDKKAAIDEAGVRFGNAVIVKKSMEHMRLSAWREDFGFDLTLDYGKGAVWHCDNGLLRMGINKPQHTTVYYSYTNMPTNGAIMLNGESKTVTGKSWFDKQGGTYDIKNRQCMWEWFSLRFFDDEEIMLFSFPQSDYQDGTYIRADGSYQRLTGYTITPERFVYPDGKTKYSAQWNIFLRGIKDERYTVTPIMEGQMNMGYYELLADINNAEGRRVGLCFAELLPGVYNKKYPTTIFSKSKDFAFMQ